MKSGLAFKTSMFKGTFIECLSVVIKEEENMKEEPIPKISFVDKCLPRNHLN